MSVKLKVDSCLFYCVPFLSSIGTDTMFRSIINTVGYDYAKTINPNTTNSIIGNIVHLCRKL